MCAVPIVERKRGMTTCGDRSVLIPSHSGCRENLGPWMLGVVALGSLSFPHSTWLACILTGVRSTHGVADDGHFLPALAN